MSLSSGARLGSYDILTPLGAGGMGEVYRATDTRLKRQVAVKILPPALAADPDRLARFRREAEVLASLNHPHIAAVYGFEDTDDTKALVMELVEGPTLADRIGQGPLPTNEALRIARQIAEALEAAHERGIVHRDLKPANIKVREDGTVKVLDFGLAKLTQSDGVTPGGQGDVSASPTLASPAMTEMGMILGTAAYMSPEQARGRAVDKRTDIWAFGAVLYEMLTGTRAFASSSDEGETVTDLIAAVLTSTPSWTSLPASVPPPIVTLIQRCLEKDRHARIGDIAVARFVLAEHAILSDSGNAARAVSSRVTASAPLLPWVLATALVAALVGGWLAWLGARRQTSTPPVTHLQVSVAPADHLQSSIQFGRMRPPQTALAVSPDGRLLVFTAARGDGTQLYSRSLDRAEATPIQGTERAAGPFLSPDGAWIGFFADNKLKKVPVAGGPPATICDVSGRAAGASWGEDGTIVFATFAGDSGIFTVSADGGAPAKVSAPDGSKRERFLLPQWLPGGKSVLFTAIASTEWDTANVVVQTVDSTERRVLIPGAADARYVATGHLLFMKSGVLSAVPFDAESQQVSGAAVPLLENVMQSVNTWSSFNEIGAGQFAVSASGTLLYVLGGIHPSRLNTPVWVDRAGVVQPMTAIPTASHLAPRLSPNGERIVVQVRRPASRGTDLWMYDAIRGAPTRLTVDSEVGSPIWSPEGDRILYSNGGLVVSRADGGGQPERLTTSDITQTSTSWTRAGLVTFLQQTPNGSNGIWILPANGSRTPQLFLETRFTLWYPEISPDGKWIAYVSDESGSPEVYVQAHPGPGQKTRVSVAGGIEPIWSPNGQELLFKTGTLEHQQFFSAAIRSLAPFRADPARLLFQAAPDSYDTTEPTRSWDISPDGRRFLMLRVVPSNDKQVTTMNIVLNWTDELKRLAPAK